MAKQYRKLIILIIVLVAIPYPIWFSVNYYAAGLVDQTQLIEFGLEDDFVYCQEWRPELLNMNKKIEESRYIPCGVRVQDGESVTIRKWESYEYNPFNWISSKGFLKIATSLIENDFEVNIQNKDGKTALHFASRYNQLEIAELLIENGANVNAKDSIDWTPLHNSAMHGHFDCVKLLLKNGAMINYQDDVGWAAIHVAARAKNLEMVKLLINNNTNIDLLCRYGTALHFAVEYHCLDIAQFLISKNANLNVIRKDGKTALELARTKEMKSLLIKNGAKTSELVKINSELDD